MAKVLKWTNKYSGEIGYVKTISKKNGHFENTTDKASARKFRYDKQVANAIQELTELGEAENNIFTAEEL